MGLQRKYLIKYISLISYILKACFNKTKTQILMKILLHNIKNYIIFGSEISFKCVPDDILEKLITKCYDDKKILKYSLQIHKCLFVGPDTLKQFNLYNMQWVFVNIMTKESTSLPVLHYNRIVLLDDLKESKCLLTSTNLFNLSNCNLTSHVIMLRIIKPLINYEPKLTRNVSISVINSFNEDTQLILDQVLYNYFSLQKFVSEGDVFKLDFNKCYPEAKYLLKPSNTSIAYIKIIKVEENNKHIILYNCKKSAYISNLHTKLNEVKFLINTYIPTEKEYTINHLKNLNINNYNDYILNVIPDGMYNDAKLLISWIMPIIQQRHTGTYVIVILI